MSADTALAFGSFCLWPAQRRLLDGGSRLLIDGEEQAARGAGEYPDIYRAFVDLIDERRSHVDVAPLRLVADALLVGRRHEVAAVQL